MQLELWKVYERPGPDGIVIEQHVYTGRIERDISCLAINEGQALRYVNSSSFQALPIAYGFNGLLVQFYETT